MYTIELTVITKVDAASYDEAEKLAISVVEQETADLRVDDHSIRVKSVGVKERGQWG